MAQPSSGWQADKARADVFMPAVKAILGRIILAEPTAFEDAHENTDLKTLVVRGTRIAVRMRDAATTPEKYWGQFTLRTSRPRGTKTELEKISEGWGDWFFYGFGDYTIGKIVSYVVIDLAAFRRRLINNIPAVRVDDRDNHDGSSGFRAYFVDDFDNRVIVHKWTRT